jgi:AcrR family transcriptional regulator
MTSNLGAPAGPRQQKRLATRARLRQAAAQLFAAQGYDATTVAQITDAAGVGERTFYRYFTSKDDLLAEQALTWTSDLHDAIQRRPAEETPYLAVARALTTLVGQAVADAGPSGYWLIAERPQPIALLRRATPRPLRHLEQTIADAVLPRIQAEAEDSAKPSAADRQQLQSQLLARVAVAVLRTAAIAHRELGRRETGSPGIEQLLQAAFTDLAGIIPPSADLDPSGSDRC